LALLGHPHHLEPRDRRPRRLHGLKAERWRSLDRAVDGTGPTIDFLLSARRNKQAARRFFRRALGRENPRPPRLIIIDRPKSSPGALRAMQRAGELGRVTRHRRGRWLTNLVAPDHRRIKRRTRPMLGFQSFRTARRTLAGVEALALRAQGPGVCRAGERRAGPAGPRRRSLRPCCMSASA
jgi:transposase-like protein